jgi:ABC-type nitrate/sulfonate/bicarbonate transport system ATPase subunit
MAFQASNLLPWRTTLENILLPLEIVQPHRGRLRRERGAYVAKVEALLAQVGLGGLGSKYPWELSGGMQQRASLCRALIHEPQLLMLDEPFAALDSFTREELWCVIRDLQGARPVTIVLVTHDLREAAFLADRIFCMSARPGRIIAERRVTFPRPRSLEVTYTPEFTELVHDPRQQIGAQRHLAGHGRLLVAAPVPLVPHAVDDARGLCDRGCVRHPARHRARRLAHRQRRQLSAAGGLQRHPQGFASLKVAITLAYVGSVIAESNASRFGIGNLITRASADFNVPLVFAALIALAILGVIIYAATVELERRTTGWAHRSGMGQG